MKSGKKSKIYVGLSGGVDSAVAAHLLIQQGYDVVGVFMKNWSGEDYGLEDECPWREDLKASQSVAEFLGIPHRTLNFELEYRQYVVDDFFKQYAHGHTPSPDILCNKFIKFDYFLNRCLEDGADAIATGHYARIERGELYRAKDPQKDQTYFLSGLTGDQLRNSLFPLGDLLKSEVRQIAQEVGLPNANRKDSQGICFIGKVDIVDFLKQKLEETAGDIVDIDTLEKVGTHKGVWFYTIGQRKGLEVGGLEKPYFVVSKDVESNTLYVGSGHDHDALNIIEVYADELDLIDPRYKKYLLSENTISIIRHRGDEISTEVIKNTEHDDYTINFAKPVWAPATGQSVVFYTDDGKCLGRAEITGVKMPFA